MLPIVKVQSGSPLTQATWKRATPVAAPTQEAARKSPAPRVRREEPAPRVRFDLPVTAAAIDFSTLTPGRARRRALRTNVRVAYGFTMESGSTTVNGTSVEPVRCHGLELQDAGGQPASGLPLTGAS